VGLLVVMKKSMENCKVWKRLCQEENCLELEFPVIQLNFNYLVPPDSLTKPFLIYLKLTSILTNLSPPRLFLLPNFFFVGQSIDFSIFFFTKIVFCAFIEEFLNSYLKKLCLWTQIRSYFYRLAYKINENKSLSFFFPRFVMIFLK
jgi:hypothetical protein